MAAITKNTIEDVIIGTYVDNVTPNVKKAGSAVKNQMDTIKKEMKALAVGLLALFSFREVKKAFNDLTNFARTYYVQSTAMVNKMDEALIRFKTVLANSETFKRTIESATFLLDMTSVMMKNAKAIQLFWNVIEKTAQAIYMGVANFWMNVLGGLVERFNIFLIAYNEIMGWIDDDFKPIRIFEAPYDDIEVFNAFGEMVKSMDDFEDFIKKNKPGAAELIGAPGMADKTIMPMSAQMGIDDRKAYEKQVENEKYLLEMKKFYARQRLEVDEQRYKLENEMIDYWEQEHIDMVEAAAQKTAEIKEEWSNMFMNGMVDAFVSGFQAIGQSIVEGENVLKNFVANFLSAIGQMAVQFGTMMILYGLAGQVVPFLGISGAAAIAVGAALVTFGGALTAIAGSMQKSAGGASTSYRPDSSFNEPSEGRQTVVTVIVQALDPSQVGDSTLRNLGLRVQKEIDKNNYLGRSPRFA